MKRFFMGFVIVSALIFFGLIAYSLTTLDQKSVSTAVWDGKLVWQRHGCTECHTIFGNGGYNAPDLTLVYQTRGEKWLSNFFSHPPMTRPGKTKRHLALNKLERGPIIQFLAFVSKQQRYGWPPDGTKGMSGRSKQRD